MSTDSPRFFPAPDPAQLTELVDVARRSALALGRHMLGSLGPDTAAVVAELQAAGWLLGVETAIDQHAAVSVTLTAIPASGLERRVIAEISQGVARSDAH